MVQLYTLASLLGALLLFLVQPMFAKMTLPLLGGTPAIWNTAMVFYQVVLLLGYAYAHYSTKLLSYKKQALLHLLILVGAAIALPISVSESLQPDDGSSPAIWLLGIYALSIGLPFFALSTMSPLLQKWFSQTKNVHSENPYFLYAASNLGSIVALLAYPILIEPNLGLSYQGKVWSFVYGLFLIVIAACIWSLFRNYRVIPNQDTKTVTVSWSHRLKWVALAFVPSSLLLSVTTHMTTDLASVPFLWILPLTIFLLTFVIVFSRKPLIKHNWMIGSQAILMVIFAFGFQYVLPDFRLNILFHLIIFFISAMVCHGQLAASKPHSSNLTEFYLFMSIGGALGGIFTALLSPVIFNSVYEYPIGLVLACFARPVLAKGLSTQLKNNILLPVIIGSVFFLIYQLVLRLNLSDELSVTIFVTCYSMFAVMVFGFRTHPIRFGLGIAFIMLLGSTMGKYYSPIFDSQRSFFAVHKITAPKDRKHVYLKHGTTVHGIQSLDPNSWKKPISYYHLNGPAGQFFKTLENNQQFKRVGLIGLGLGTLTCYQEAHQQWKIFEIDPMVVEIANDTDYFHYMEQCGRNIPVVLGDARLSLKYEEDGLLDVLVLDAFSSDSIPVHLLTEEAFNLYFKKLSDHGLLLIHISNRYLNLEPIISKHAETSSYFARTQLYPGTPEDIREDVISHWVVLSKSENSIKLSANNSRWAPLIAAEEIALWTDDFSNLWQVIIWPK